MKRKILFRGTGTALVTPFTLQGEIDEQAIKKLVDYQIRGGVEALIPAGTTGEGATLSEDEQAKVVFLVSKYAKERVKIIAGAGSNSTMKAVTLGKRMLAEGADAILSVTPYYNKPTQEGIYQHYATLASEIDAPLVIYNVPGRTSCNIESQTTLKIAKNFRNIVGIKEASGNLGQIMDILRKRPNGFGVWSGDDSLTLPLIALGADGVISVISNEIPKHFSDMVRLCLKGEFQKAIKIHNRLLDLMNFNFIESNPIPVKAVMAEIGMIEENYRLPLVKLSNQYREKMRGILRDLRLI